MAEKNLKQKRQPEANAVFDNSFDNAFVVLDNPDDAAIEQKGNGTTMVANDNPDDIEDMIGMEN